MRAVVFEEFGEPADVLKLRDIDTPVPQSGEIRVRMLASPVNPSDLMTVRGIYGKLPELPATPGFEGVGIVETSGGGLLGKLLVGKRVAVLNRQTGNWAEQTVIPAKQAIPIDKTFSNEQAATFFVNPATAYVMTRKVLRVPAGDWLLQTAAGSALGRMVIRLGKRFGFRTLNVVRRQQQADELISLGADEVVVFDRQQHEPDRLIAEVLRLTHDSGVRFAIDPVAGVTGSAVAGCLGKDGRMLVFGTLCDEPLSFPPRALMTPGASIHGFWLTNWMNEQSLFGKLKLVREITRLMKDGILVSQIGETFPLGEVADAVREAEKPGRGGKVLLWLAEQS